MAKRVLDIGQCSPDHYAISRLLKSRFGAEVVHAHGWRDNDAGRGNFAARHFDLVLVNRKLDADYSDGLEIAKAIKDDPAASPACR